MLHRLSSNHCYIELAILSPFVLLLNFLVFLDLIFHFTNLMCELRLFIYLFQSKIKWDYYGQLGEFSVLNLWYTTILCARCFITISFQLFSATLIRTQCTDLFHFKLQLSLSIIRRFPDRPTTHAPTNLISLLVHFLFLQSCWVLKVLLLY